MALIKQNSSYVRTFLLIDSTDHISGKTSAASIVVKISKAGASGVSPNTGSAAQVDSTNNPGLYKITFDSTDTNTVGEFSVHVTATGCDPTDFLDQVFAASIDDLVRSTTPANTLDVSATGEAGIDWGNIGSKTTTNALTATTIATTQKVDIETIKTQTVTAAAAVTVNANVGTTQPVNFTGTGASALAKSDMVDIAGAVVSPSTAQIGVNAVQAGGTAWGSGAITAAAIADGAIDAATFAAGAIDATAIATDALGSLELAAGAAVEIGDEVWNRLTSAITTSGSIGKQIKDNLDAAITSRLAPTTPGNTLDVSATGEAGLDFANIKDATGAHTLTNITVPAVTTVTANVEGNVTGEVGSLGTQAKTDVHMEVMSNLSSEAYSDPGPGAPPEPATLATKIGHMYKTWKNKATSDGSTVKYFAADGTTCDQKAAVSEAAGTVTRAAVVSGP